MGDKEGIVKDIPQSVIRNDGIGRKTNELMLQRIAYGIEQEQERVQKELKEALPNLSPNDREKCMARGKIKVAMLKILKIERIEREMDKSIQEESQNVREMHWAKREKKRAMQKFIEDAMVQRGIGPVQDEPLDEEEVLRIKQQINDVIWWVNDEQGREWVHAEREELEGEAFRDEEDKCNARREIKEAMHTIFQCEKIQRIMNESKLGDFRRDKEYYRIKREIIESMWRITVQNEPERQLVEREIAEAKKVCQNEQENYTVRSEINKAMRSILQTEQESERVRREMEKAERESLIEQENRKAKGDANEVVKDNAHASGATSWWTKGFSGR